MIVSLPKPVRILDVGGTQLFWENMRFCGADEMRCVILNLLEIKTTLPNFRSIVGDARDMHQINDNEFDVAFSNSVIQFVGPGGYEDQREMAKEIRRVANKFFVQTPYRHFPMEPHYLLPFFQYLPLAAKVWLLTHFKIGWCNNIPNRQTALEIARQVRLLTKKELAELFPHGTITEEKVLGITKSLIVHN
jgi:hypothetical protein